MSWSRLKQDVFIWTPMDDRPQHEQDMIRTRRRDAFENSSIPWVVSDAVGLLTFLDDIDDLGKSAKFIKGFAFDPLRAISGGGRKGFRDWWRRDKDAFKKLCGGDDFPRRRKKVFAKVARLDFLSFAALQALKTIFPSWRFIALGLQFLQSTEMLFGVGVSLGPVMGAAIESAVRGLANLGAPFSPATNKYNQILAARVAQRLDKGLPAMAAMHPDDALSAAIGALAASNVPIIPPIVIEPSEYPDFGDLLTGDAEQLGNLGSALAALPWNLGAFFINDFLAPMLRNWANLLGAAGADADLPLDWHESSGLLAELIESDTCAGPFCAAEVDIGLAIASSDSDRFDLQDGRLLSRDQLFRRLGWSGRGERGPIDPDRDLR